jgi:CHAD domain-containing protein
MRALFLTEHADDPDVTGPLAAAGFSFGEERETSTTVLDTYDGRLFARGLRLELRESSGDAGLVLLDLRGSPPASLTATSAPRFAEELPPGPFRARILAAASERALLPVLTARSRQRDAIRRDRRQKVVARLTLHQDVVASAGEADVTVAARAVELHTIAGHERQATRAREVLRRSGWRATRDDLASAAAQLLAVDLRGRSTSPTVPLERREPAFDAFRKVLANLAATIEENRPGTVDDIDPEFLHELRVGVRRTRSVLSQARGILPEDVRALRRIDFGWLGTVTGPARDLDVYVLEWEDYIDPLGASARAELEGVLAEIRVRRTAAHAALAKDLSSDRYRDLITTWTRWLAADGHRVEGGDLKVGEVVADRIDRAQRRLLKRGRAITADTPAQALHDLRKDAKRLRYLLECFGSLLDGSARRAFVQRLKSLQDNLGEFQDTEVHMIQLRDLAHELHRAGAIYTDALLAMGQLTEHLDQRRVAARAEFDERFSAFDSPTTRRALHELVRPLTRSR